MSNNQKLIAVLGATGHQGGRRGTRAAGERSFQSARIDA
jgi:hypothetical protein